MPFRPMPSSSSSPPARAGGSQGVGGSILAERGPRGERHCAKRDQVECPGRVTYAGSRCGIRVGAWWEPRPKSWEPPSRSTVIIVGAAGDTYLFYNTKGYEGRKNRPAEQSDRFLSRVLTFLEFYRSSFRSWSQAGTGFYSRLRHIPVVGRVLQPSAPHPCLQHL